MLGYAGKLLFVDLDNGTFETRELDPVTAKNYVGGPALGAKILFDEMPAGAGVFSSESMVGFVAGPANGTGPFMGGRYTVVSKSPVTGGWNDANSGGMFGMYMKKAGYDGVFVRGISKTPVYIDINDGVPELRDASHLWGKTTIETERAIKQELCDEKIGISLIGPAGEHRSYMAAVMNDTHRAAGRGGTGAVMGSKNLKALVCRGGKTLEVADKAAVVAINKETIAWEKGPVAPVVQAFSGGGTGSSYESCVLLGDSSVKNWGGFSGELSEEQIKAIASQAMDARFKVKKYACNACPVGCGAIYDALQSKWPIKEETSRPEYETMGMFGSQLLNGDQDSVNYCNFLCNEYGYDTISFGGTIAWLMECYNNGLFTLEELDGIDLKWGNAEAIVAIAERICAYTGIGVPLNLASRGAARHFNRGFEYLVTASGIEIPQHDARYAPGLARTYQYDPTPGRHVKGGTGMNTGGQPPEVKYNYDDPARGAQDVADLYGAEVQNAGGFCNFSGFGLPPGAMIRYISAVTGFTYTEEEDKLLGLRSYTMRHAFNMREGLRRKDFDISPRIVGKPPLTDGPLAGVTVDHEKLADSFFEALGWDVETAMPSKEALEKIGGMEPVIAALYPNS